MSIVQRITPCLWFDDQAEEAARFYTSIFEIDGQSFTALDGGPDFKFNEAISFQVNCDSQAELDEFWEKLSACGDPQAQQCGWLENKHELC